MENDRAVEVVLRWVCHRVWSYSRISAWGAPAASRPRLGRQNGVQEVLGHVWSVLGPSEAAWGVHGHVWGVQRVLGHVEGVLGHVLGVREHVWGRSEGVLEPQGPRNNFETQRGPKRPRSSEASVENIV